MHKSIDIHINGQLRQFPEETTVASLLIQMGLEQQPCAVERNLEIVPRENYAKVQLQANDHLEIVTLVGGG